MKHFARLFFTLCLCSFFNLTALAQGIIYGAEKGPAIEGYDTVAYFTESKPVKGKSEWSVEWMGAQWLFSSLENKEKFLDNPEQYAPQFDAHCAYAAANNSVASGDPKQWKIVEGKLYLNTNRFAAWLWEKSIPDNIRDGERNWPAIKLGLAAKKNQ